MPNPKSKNVLALSDWYKKNHRTLPWRANTDPYRIWISEVMLQQTQVATVIPYFERFLAAFPTLRALATAPTDQVLTLWSGLGYYSRARNLQKGAQFIVEQYGGNFPKTREQILEVPGVGPYTAGAILSIAFDLPEAIVDGNVQRVLTRVFAWQKPLEEKATKDWLWQEAKLWVECSDSPRVLNQAIMELGATVCRKDQPQCTRCPLATTCQGFRSGQPNQYPLRKPRRKPVDLWWSALVAVHRGKVLLQQHPQGDWWEGLWSLPYRPGDSAAAAEQALKSVCDPAAATVQLGEIRHTVTHHRLHVLPTVWQPKKKPPLEGRWVDLAQTDSMALSSLARKILLSATNQLEMLK
jgi:A/G-specific adenine glycosylase